MSFRTLVEPGLYVVSDTFLCDGVGVMMLLLKNHGKKASFFSDPGNYSHFNSLFKKHGIHTNYLEISCNLEIGDLPMTEDPPVTWLDAPKRVAISNIVKEAEKSMLSVIVLDDIQTLLLELGEKNCIGLINSLKCLCEVLIVKCNVHVLNELWMLKMNCDVLIEVTELESGFSVEYQGRVKVFHKQNFVKTEIGCFWFQILNDNFEIIES